MNKIKYFFQFLIVIIMFFIFKLLGLRLSSYLGGKVFQIIGPFFRSKNLIHQNIMKAFPNIDEKKMNEIVNELPNTYQTPTMSPFCKDEEKYNVVNDLVNEIQSIKKNKTKIDDQIIEKVLTVNGVRFSFIDGSWGLIRASSNKPSLVVVTESPTSNDRMKKIFHFIDELLQKTGKVGEYDQKI